jgi:hypothetical protein
MLLDRASRREKMIRFEGGLLGGIGVLFSPEMNCRHSGQRQIVRLGRQSLQRAGFEFRPIVRLLSASSKEK